jgi:hypothetical protein
MPASLSPALKTAVQPHFHFNGQTCPYCDQSIPEDRLEETSGRIEARARERLTEETGLLREQHARERAQAEAKAKAELERARKDAAAREALIREEAARIANETAQIKIAAAQKAQVEAEQARAGVAGQIEEMRARNAETIAQMTRDAAAREKAIRTEAAATAEEALRERLAAAEGAKTEAETARAGMAAQLEAERDDKAETIARLSRASAAREAAIREEAAKTAEAGAAEKIAAAENAKAEAENGRAAAEAALTAKLDERGREIEALKEAQASEISVQREALEKDKVAALNAERANALKVQMKLEQQLGDIQRKLQQKTAHEHGEGAELELFDVLKAAFEGDRIRRVPKGALGADIIHEVVEGGKVVGKIVYDRKNRGDFKSEYATKLRKDQIAEKAEFAVLSTHKFPKDERELCTFENVILASPARVLALAEILRGQIVGNHELRVSAVEREKKSAELYAFINSPLAGQLLDSVESLVGKMDLLDADEQNAHRKVWDKRAILRQSVLKANGDFRSQIRRVVGNVDDDAGDGKTDTEES